MIRRSLAVLILAAALPASAQPPNAQPQIQSFVPPQPSRVSVEFKGGTVQQYIDALKQSGKAVNVVASERASKQFLAPVSLKDVTVGVAVFSIQAAATSGSGNWRIDPISVPGQPAYPGDNVDGTYAVDFYPYGKRGEDLVVESYSLQRIIGTQKGEGIDPKIVLTAIETGLKMQNEGAEQPPDLQFHADSALLFVRGTKEDVRLVGSIVSRMTEDAVSRRATAERRAGERAVREISIKEAQLEVQLREMEHAAAQNLLDQTKKMVEQAAMPASEGTRAELELARSRVALERAKLNLERMQIVPIDLGREEPAKVTPPKAPAQPEPVPAPANPGKSTKRPSPK